MENALVSATKVRAGWLLPAALLVLSAIPIIAGAMRLGGLAGGTEVTPENARFVAAPVPVVLHIVGASVYCVLGAFQFGPRFRRERPRWHRRAGWVSTGCGLVAGLAGLWMTLFYPRVAGDGDALDGLRLVFGSAMVACIVLGLASILRRDVAQHGAWMMRGYAIGIGAGTQVLVHLPWMILGKQPGEHGRALLLGAGWVINVAVAEWIIRRRRERSMISVDGALAGALFPAKQGASKFPSPLHPA